MLCIGAGADDAGLRALTHVAAGVKVIEIVRCGFQTLQIILHRFAGECAGVFVCGAGIDRIRRVGEQHGKVVFRRQLV